MSKKEKKNKGLAVMSLVTGDLTSLYWMLKMLGNFVEEAIFKVDYNEVAITQMDSSRISLADYRLCKEAFDEWFVHKKGYFSLCIPVVLRAVFTRIKKEDRLEIFVDGKDEQITFTIDRRGRKIKRVLPIMLDYQPEQIPIPKIRGFPDASYTLELQPFIEDLQDISKIADTVTFHARHDALILTAKGDYSEVENVYKRGTDLFLNCKVDRECKATYSIAGLLELAVPKEASKISQIVTIAFSNDHPLRAKFHAGVPFELTHWLAPRVES